MPDTLTRITVVGQYEDPNNIGADLTGKVIKFRPDYKGPLINSAGDIMGAPITASTTLASDGTFSILLVATDSPDMLPNDWTYTVFPPFQIEPYPIKVPSDSPGGVFDLMAAIPFGTVTGGTVILVPGKGLESFSFDSNTPPHLIAHYTDGSTQDLGAVTGISGRGIASVDITGGHLIVTYDDATTHDAGVVKAISTIAFDSETPPHLIITFTDASTTDLGVLPGGSGSGTITSVDGDTGPTVVLAPTGMTPPAATLTERPWNVRDQANPLANAIMDGTTHPLSGRFASLSDAHAVFPSAVALTDEIDYWAIQSLLTSHHHIDLAWGTAILHQALVYNSGTTIRGFGDRGATTLMLRAAANDYVLVPSDLVNENPSVYMADFTVDGNKANNTAAIGQTDGIRVFRGKDLKMRDIEVRNMNGRGIHIQSVTGTVCQVGSLRSIYCHDNMHWGLWVTNGVRKMTYDGITCDNNGLRTDLSRTNTGNAADNFTGGFLFDHSESSATNVQCHNNGQYGLWIRNVFDCQLTNIRAAQNAQHGIRVLGFVDSNGSDWLSQANGQDSTITGDHRDIWFDGTSSLNYGITAHCKLDNIQAGPSLSASIATQGAFTSPEDWAIYFDDAMTGSDMEIHTYTKPGTLGDVRFPTAGTGTMLFGNGPSGLDKVSNNLTSGTTYSLPDVNVATMHRVVLTANCAITIPPAAAGKIIAVSLVQDGTGSRIVTWSAATGSIKWAGGGTAPTLTTSAGGADAVAFECYDGTHWIGIVVGQNI